MFGAGYIVDHCLLELQKKGREKAYRAYVTDTLMVISQNTTNHVGMNGAVEMGSKMTKRWIDIAEPAKKKDPPKEDPRSCNEIAADIWSHGFGG